MRPESGHADMRSRCHALRCCWSRACACSEAHDDSSRGIGFCARAPMVLTAAASRRTRTPRAVFARGCSLLALLSILFVQPGTPCRGETPPARRVYVTLGFHANFYHSWRGDTPDDAGFGTDIRVVREILRMLDNANARASTHGATGSPTSTSPWKRSCPSTRPTSSTGSAGDSPGLDEILVAPYDNGILSGMTEDEARAALRWAVSNPWGSGVRTSSVVRADRAATRVHDHYRPHPHPRGRRNARPHSRVLELSVHRVLQLRARLAPANATTRRGAPAAGRTPHPRAPGGEPRRRHRLRIARKVAARLRQLQTNGDVNGDLLIHLNFDADAETWLPVACRPALAGCRTPADCASTSTPSTSTIGRRSRRRASTCAIMRRSAKCSSARPRRWRVGRILLVDGEAPSHEIWTMIQQSRLATRRAEALLAGLPAEVAGRARAVLFEGRDSSFFQRIRAMSTTHFGMSTPLVNEERQAVAEEIATAARDRALEAQRLIAREITNSTGARLNPEVAYRFLIRDLRDPRTGSASAQALVRIPIVHPGPPSSWMVSDEAGRPVEFSVVNREALPGTAAGELLLVVSAPRRAGHLRARLLTGAVARTCDARWRFPPLE